jgi:hypothetical protein
VHPSAFVNLHCTGTMRSELVLTLACSSSGFRPIGGKAGNVCVKRHMSPAGACALCRAQRHWAHGAPRAPPVPTFSVNTSRRRVDVRANWAMVIEGERNVLLGWRVDPPVTSAPIPARPGHASPARPGQPPGDGDYSADSTGLSPGNDPLHSKLNCHSRGRYRLQAVVFKKRPRSTGAAAEKEGDGPWAHPWTGR